MTRRFPFPVPGFALRLALFYAAMFIIVGIQLPFFPLWLEAKGFSAREIGFLLAVPMVVRLFAIPLATGWADRHDAIRTVMIGATASAALAYAVLGLAEQRWLIIALFAVASFGYAPILSLTDAYALRGLAGHKRPYGHVRLWGSAAFIGGSLIAGLAADVLAPKDLIWLVAGGYALSALTGLNLAPLASSSHHATAATPYRSLLHDPAFLSVLLAAGLIQSSHAVYYGFSTLDWSAAGLNGTIIALLWALGVLAEIALFALSGRLPAWLTPFGLIGIGAAGAVIRWTAMAFDPPAILLPGLQVLHALSFGATHLGAVGYLVRAAKPGQGARAQGYLAIVLGLTMAGSMIAAGALYAAFGARAYVGMALAAAAGGACALFAKRLSQSTAD